MALDALTSTLAAVSHEQWCDCFGAVGALTFPLLFSVNPAYGKTFRRSWGRPLSGRWGWFVQEIIAPVTLLWSYYSARATNESLLTPQPVHVFLFLFTLHYANRAVLYPLQRHMSPTSLVVVLSSILFNLVNGHLIGVELATRTAAHARKKRASRDAISPPRPRWPSRSRWTGPARCCSCRPRPASCDCRPRTRTRRPRGVGDAHARSQRQTRNAASYADRAMPPSVSVT